MTGDEEDPVTAGTRTGEAPVPGGLQTAVDAPTEGSALIRLYFKSQRAMQLYSLATSSIFTGFWLGFLSREQIHAVGEHYFKKERFYRTDEYNTRGLFDWEKRAVEKHFGGCKRLLVAAAGGGREVIALRKLGFEVDGFEAHPELLSFANDLLEREGMIPDIRPAPWDHCPPISEKYDGALVGWGAYMHIRGRQRRIGFLRELRQTLKEGAPLLLSFYVRGEKARYHRWVGKFGRATARVLRRETVDTGDCLLPFYAHFFTQRPLEEELVAGGFEPVAYELYEYGHAIGRVV